MDLLMLIGMLWSLVREGDIMDLVTCTGRRYNGGGYSKIDFVQGIMIFAPRKDAY